MRFFSPTFALRSLVLWNAVRTVWIGFFAFVDLLTLVAVAGPKGPYLGIGLNPRFLFTVAAMPFKLVGVIAGFRFGLLGEATVEIAATAVYASIAIGIWYHSNRIRQLAVSLSVLESLLLILYLSYAATFPFVSELRPAAVLFCSAFIFIYSFSAIWLLRANAKKFFPANIGSAIGT